MSLSLPPLPPDSEAFRVIQYQLQQQMNAVRVKVLEAFDVTSITQTQLFAQYCQTINPINVIHAFIPTTDLQQPISDIATRGVRVNPKRGLRFRADHVIADPNKEIVEVIHCLVALGNTQNYMKFDTDLENKDFVNSQPTSEDLMQGYNSLCVSNSNEYVIFNPDQIRTLQFIRVQAGELLENKPELSGTCDLCQREEATCYCLNCSARLCDHCNHASHDSNKLLQAHTRISIEEAKPLMEFCPFHPNNRVEHFCPECQMPVCIECKMSGSHSRGIAMRHQLIPLKDAYFAALRAGANENRIYIRRRHILNEKMRDADRRMRDVILNSKTLEARIMKIAQEAIASLHEQAAERVEIIASTKTEIQRKLDECDAKAEFLQETLKFASPVSAIRSLTVHDKVVNELRQDNDLPRALAVEGDLALAGVLEVKTKQEIIMPVGVKNRDVYFDERYVRNVDFPSSTFDSQSTTMYDTTATASTVTASTARREAPRVHLDRSVVSETATYSESLATEERAERAEQKRRSRDVSLVRVITLTQMALRKEQKLKEQGRDIDFIPFEGSAIIRNPEIGRRIYMCLPFKALPKPHILFSTEKYGRSMKSLHEFIDNVGITVVIIRRGEYIFGGFAAAKWNADGRPFGDNTSCFVFSLNRDMFIPYRPRASSAYFLKGAPNMISFGGDITIADNFDRCTGSIEHSYGIGIDPECPEAKAFFCGEEVFPADVVEVWGFFTVDQ